MLLGASDALFTATGSPSATFQALVSYHDACVRAAREVLGDKVFDATLERGMAMNLDEVVAWALD